ncbi:zinc-ribbon domain-containing protein [Elioraea rosea]|uniref:zinc-ribbon domain-containing protein n=1 Tax=Elioraea rosea TaxID=2492390 RepID=UPI0011831D09|nr:zinc-ribbon domain-containing protein [Elioraea rosea]
MIIECPRCSARYDVAESLIGAAGKSVRCAKCGNVWLARRDMQDADAPVQWPEAPQRPARAEASEIPPSPEPAEDEALAEFREAQEGKGGFARFPTPPDGPPAARPRLGGAATIGWVATILVLGAAGWGAYAYRDAVVQAWPPSERVYLALGLRS